MEHQFVTPLTALLVESEGATERLLADAPKDPKHGCCSGDYRHTNEFSALRQERLGSDLCDPCDPCEGAGVGGIKGGRLPQTSGVVYQRPPWVTDVTSAPPGQVVRGPVDELLPKKINLGNRLRSVQLQLTVQRAERT